MQFLKEADIPRSTAYNFFKRRNPIIKTLAKIMHASAYVRGNPAIKISNSIGTEFMISKDCLSETSSRLCEQVKKLRLKEHTFS
jgi:predicted transcriptional regulator